MLLIGEVSKISQVSLRMLRYYDKNDIFKPKIINQENGYRYYTADQLDDLYKIVELRNLGFGVSEIKRLISTDNNALILEEIEKKREELTQIVSDASFKLQRLEGLKKDICNEDTDHQKFSIVLKKIPDMDVISYRRTVDNYFCESGMWAEFGRLLSGTGFDFTTECFSLYHDLDYREENVDIELCAVIDKPLKKIPEGLVHRQVKGSEYAVSILVKGSYENISPAYRAFAHWLEKHDEYKTSGPNRQICFVSPINTDDPEEYVTELLIPLKCV